MIQVEHISKLYGSFRAVDRVSFSVQPGEIVGFLGPNGAGKSTTLRVLAGFLGATSGAVRIAGIDVAEDSLRARARIGYMPEMSPLYPEMRVGEYLRFRAELKKVPRGQRKEAALRAMREARVDDFEEVMIGHLSKGYRQRVGLADALVASPPLLILDEPTAGLDPVQIRQVRELLRDLRSRHTVLLSTHILHEVEQACDRVVMLHRGRILANDTPRNLASQLKTSTLVHVELETADKEAAAKLEKIKGVRKCNEEAANGGAWRHLVLRVEPGFDVREEVQALAATEGWKVRELHRELPTLEDVFVELASTAEQLKGGLS